jgi:hypothetical protein
MVTPRNTYSGTSITTSSESLADPAVVLLAREDAAARALEGPDERLARIVAALERLRPSWHRDPARGCADMAPAMFVSGQPKDRAAAFAACGRCPTEIRKACARWAIEVGDTEAIAGGSDGSARRPLIREYRRQVAERNAAAEAERQRLEQLDAAT